MVFYNFEWCCKVQEVKLITAPCKAAVVLLFVFFVFVFFNRRYWYFSYFSMKTYFAGSYLIEALLMNIHKVCFHREIKKNVYLHTTLLWSTDWSCHTKRRLSVYVDKERVHQYIRVFTLHRFCMPGFLHETWTDCRTVQFTVCIVQSSFLRISSKALFSMKKY